MFTFDMKLLESALPCCVILKNGTVKCIFVYCCMLYYISKGLFSFILKDCLDKWSWVLTSRCPHIKAKVSRKKGAIFYENGPQKIKLLEWCSFKLFCSTSSHHFNFVWMYVFNAFSHYNKKNRKTSTNTNLNFDAKKSRFIFTSTSARVK